MSDGVTVLAGCLRNASAIVKAALAVAAGAPIGLIPAGERWDVTTGGPLRPGIEDLLGAGAIAAALLATDATDASSEVRLAAMAFLSAVAELSSLLEGCSSGRELIAAGHRADIELATELERSTAVPLLRNGVFEDKRRA